MEKEKINELEKQLEESAKRMAEYRREGLFEQELEEHQTYNEIIKQINDLNEKLEKISREEQITKLEKKLEESAKKIAEYRREGFLEQEAEEHQTYNEIIKQINDLKKQEKPEGSIIIEEQDRKGQAKPKETEKPKKPEGSIIIEEQDRKGQVKPKETEKPKKPEGSISFEGQDGKGQAKLKETEKPKKPESSIIIEEPDRKEQEKPEEKELGDLSIEEPNNKNLPIRSFWEIYNDTCTEHVGSIANAINKLAHMQTITYFFNKNEDTVHKILNIIPTPFKIILKGVAIIPNAIMGTDEKIQAMRENIEDLSQEDFEVLVQKPEDVNQMFNKKVKDSFDRDYLDTQFMKQYKVNNAYLDVVKERLDRERGAAIEYYNEQATLSLDRLKELEEIGIENLTPAQKQEYFLEKTTYDSCVSEGKKCAKEITDFEEGAKKKSSAHRNISGWLLAKFNPDNREENSQMAELSKARREMGEIGNDLQVNSLSVKMEELAEENTKTVQFGRNENNILDIGKNSKKSPIEIINRGEQTKGRLLLTNIMSVSALMGLYKQVKNIVSNRELVARHNQHLTSVNSKNSNISVEGKVKISDSADAPEVENVISKQTVEAGLNRAERGNLDGNNWNLGTPYHQADVQAHADAAQVAEKADGLMKQGKNLEALKSATGYYSQVQNGTRANISNYMSVHPEHDYTAFSFGDTANMDKVYEFFANGTIGYQTNITGTMAEMMGKLKEGLDLNGVLFATATSLYNAQREGTKNIRNRVKVEVDATNQRDDDSEGENLEREEYAGDAENISRREGYGVGTATTMAGNMQASNSAMRVSGDVATTDSPVMRASGYVATTDSPVMRASGYAATTDSTTMRTSRDVTNACKTMGVMENSPINDATEVEVNAYGPDYDETTDVLTGASKYFKNLVHGVGHKIGRKKDKDDDELMQD